MAIPTDTLINFGLGLAADIVAWIRQRNDAGEGIPTDADVVARVKSKIATGDAEGDAWLAAHPARTGDTHQDAADGGPMTMKLAARPVGTTGIVVSAEPVAQDPPHTGTAEHPDAIDPSGGSTLGD